MLMRKKDPQNQLYRLNEDVVYRVVDDEAVILNVAKGEHFSLNKIGTEILKFLDEKKSVPELIAYQANKYKQKIETLKNDAVFFVDELLKSNIIEEVKE